MFAEMFAAMLLAAPLAVRFENVAAEAGLVQAIPNGGNASKQFIIETTGSGVAFIDYDNDGLLDLFIASGQGGTSRLYHNEGGGKLKDVTEPMGLTQSGWAQGVCAGDYDNDGFTDLFVTYWGANHLYRNREGHGFEDVTERAHLTQDRTRYNTGCAFLDYDNDGHLDLFVANYLKFDPKTTPKPGANPYCFYREMAVNCGPRGLPFDRNILYRNNGHGVFEDVSDKSGISAPNQNYSLGVLTGDFNNDGLPDIYVACDQTPSLLYINQGNGKFEEEGLLRGVAFDSNGKALSGMGVSAADYDGSGSLSIFRTNFSDERETLYRSQNTRGEFEDVTIAAGLARNTRFVGWGCGFFDFDNDGWKDLLIVNGHVFPEVERLKLDIHYKDRAILYRNLGDGKFADISEQAGPGIVERHSSRGAAFGDYDNDGRIEVLVNNQNEPPSLLKQKTGNGNHWVILKLTGTRSNRSAIGAKVRVIADGRTQMDEVRSGGSYLSQNDLRLHFGLGAATAIDEVRVEWPSGIRQVERNVPVDRVIPVTESDSIHGSSVERELRAAELLHLAQPSAAERLVERALAAARSVSEADYYDAMIRYRTRIGDWDQAILSAKLAKDAGFITIDATRQLLADLAVSKPRAGADLFADLLAAMPASIRQTKDVLFMIENMEAFAPIDAAVAVQAAERIAGSAESPDFHLAEKAPLQASFAIGSKRVLTKSTRETALFIAGAYLAAFDRQRFAWHAESLAPWRDTLKGFSASNVNQIANGVPRSVIKSAPAADMTVLAEALQDTLDSAFGLKSMRGKAVLVNFWEPWCAPCKRERPRLEKLAQEWKDRGLVLVGVSEHPELHDQFEVVELPVTLVFNRRGRLLARLTGEQTEADLVRAIDLAARD